jgi:hypothetical protein
MPVAPVDLENKKILITGPTGQVALPVVEHFAGWRMSMRWRVFARKKIER